MNCPLCDRPMFGDTCPCGYAPPAQKAGFIPRKPTAPPGITKAEFGVALYDTIQACGALLQIRKMLQGARNDTVCYPDNPRYQQQVDDLTKREAVAVKTVVDQLSALPESQQNEVLDRYPQLVGQHCG